MSVPTVYDFCSDETRPATQADIDKMMASLAKKSDQLEIIRRVNPLPPRVYVDPAPGVPPGDYNKYLRPHNDRQNEASAKNAEFQAWQSGVTV